VVVAKSPIVTPICSAPGFALQPRDHRLRQVDPVHAYAPLRERHCDSPGADAELERTPVASELDEEVDDRVDDGRVEHVGGRLVVPLCHTLAEVVLGHVAHSFIQEAVNSGLPPIRLTTCPDGRSG
jgi:hypothetical protein